MVLTATDITAMNFNNTGLPAMVLSDTRGGVKAYCPGHITGIFTIEDDDPDLLKRGSRGLGFCTELGAISEASFRAGTGIIDICINGEASNAPVTRMALEHMLPKLSVDIDIDIQLQAPMGQGFGMSAAGTFATCLATATYLNIFNPMIAALRATHVAEVSSGAGLGDAMAQSKGGFVHRTAPGVSRMSNAERLATPDTEVVFCILGKELSTRNIIQDPERKKIISQEGERYLAEWEKKPDLDNFISQSGQFAEATGLLTGEMTEALDSVEGPGLGKGSMAMLGNTIFAIGEDVPRIKKELAGYGRVIGTRITSSIPEIIIPPY